MKLVKTYKLYKINKLWFRNRKGSGLKKCCGTGKNDSLLGRRFGKLKTYELVKRGESTYFKCYCDCGGETIVSQMSLMSSKKRSCGKCDKTL